MKFLNFFLIFLIILFSSSVKAITETDCLINLVDKFSFVFPIVNGTYNICTLANQKCDENGSLTMIDLTNPDPQDVTIFNVFDLLCFPNLISVKLSNFVIDSPFFTIKIPKCLSIQFIDSTFLNKVIENEIPQYDNFFIISKSFNNSNLDLSYLKNIKQFTLIDSRVKLLEPKDPNSVLSEITVSSINLVDFTKFTNLESVNIELSKGFGYSTISLISTIKASKSIKLKSLSSDAPIPLSVFSITDFKTPSLSLYKEFETPLEYIDLTSFPTSIKLTISSPSSNFNVNGSIPFKGNENLVIEFDNAVYNSLQPLSQYLPYKKVSFLSSEFTQNPSLGSYQGDFEYIQFNDCGATGTNIDSSWCSTNLVVQDNKLTGTIPSCFKCYFEDLETDKNYPSLPIMKDRFTLNSFTNLDTTEPCTTFAPKPQIIDSSTLLITGTDIGFKPYNYFIEETECSYTVKELGKSYQCDNLNGLLDNKSYYSIRFLHPGNKTLTFPVSQNTPPNIESVIIIGNTITINGQFFSSYNGYISQSVKIQNLDCIIGGDSGFFKITCTVSKFTQTEKIPLELNVNSIKPKVLVSKTLPNNKQCPNNCINVENGICDMTSGLCLCQVNNLYQDCNTHTISSIEPSNENGGEAIFYGSFTDKHDELSITIGDQQCTPITLNTSTIIKCVAPAGKGIKSVTMIQNDLTFIGKDMYKYKSLSLLCPNNCTNINQGICNTTTGSCNCKNGYQTFDCSIKSNDNNNNGGGNNNGGETTIDPDTGSTNVTNGQTRFQIYFNVLNEVDIQGNLINSHILKDNWIINNTKDSIYTFKQQLNDTNCIITSTIEEITNENGKSFTFADTTFNLSKDSIKFTISIENYPYKSTLNTLSLEFVSTVDQLTSQSTCNSKDTEIDTSNVNDISTFNYIKISKNNQILTGRFINKLISDSRPTFYSTTIKNDSTSTTASNTNSSIILSLNLPHCNICIIDPDFSLVLSNDFQNECSSSSRTWLIPVVVVVPVVGVAFIITAVAVLYKNNTKVKIFVKGSKLKSFTNKN